MSTIMGSFVQRMLGQGAVSCRRVRTLLNGDCGFRFGLGGESEVRECAPWSATALADSGEVFRAFDVLERMFSSTVVQDTRAMPTFERAGRFDRELAKRLAQESIEAAETEFETIAREAERVSGFPVRFEEGDFGVQMTASTELTWKPRSVQKLRCSH